MPSGQFTITMDTPGLLERIEIKLEPPRPDCLIWPGAVDRGYGRIWVDGTAKRVHRVIWELKNGPIPDGLTIDHLCRIRACCNTEHMELVTGTENIRRAGDHRRFLGPLVKATHCKRGHEYSDENTYVNPKGKRSCRACVRIRYEARKQGDALPRAA